MAATDSIFWFAFTSVFFLSFVRGELCPAALITFNTTILIISFFPSIFFLSSQKLSAGSHISCKYLFYVSLFSFLFLRLDWDAALKGVLFPGCYFAFIFSLSTLRAGLINQVFSVLRNFKGCCGNIKLKDC